MYGIHKGVRKVILKFRDLHAALLLLTFMASRPRRVMMLDEIGNMKV